MPAWTDESTKSSGHVVTAGEFNNTAINNPEHLRERIYGQALAHHVLGEEADDGLTGSPTGAALSKTGTTMPLFRREFAASGMTDIWWMFKVPHYAPSAGNVTLKLWITYSTSTTSGNVRWNSSYGFVSVNSGERTSAATLTTLSAATVAAPSGGAGVDKPVTLSKDITLPTIASGNEGPMLCIRVSRLGDHSADTCTGTAYIYAIAFELAGR